VAGREFVPTSRGCAACIEGVRFGGFDPQNPVLSFCTCGEGVLLAGVTEEMLRRAGVGDGEQAIYGR